jgi:hypothetical protein
MREQDDLNQQFSQQQQEDSNAIATELAKVRNELRELKEQSNSKKLLTSNQIAAGILKAKVVVFLLLIIPSVVIISLFWGLIHSFSSMQLEKPGSLENSPQLNQ